MNMKMNIDFIVENLSIKFISEIAMDYWYLI